MGHLLRSLAVIAVLVASAAPLAAFEGPTQSAGGSKKAPAKGSSAAKKGKAAAEKKDDKAAATAQRMLDTGVSAYGAGKTNQAIRAFDTVISGGTLNSRQMARALYYRGLSYRKKSNPARAIADLSAAAWIKDGLSASEQQEAMSNRAAAYRDAGITNVPAAAQPTGVAGGSFGVGGWQTAASPQSAAPAPAASAPASAPQTTTPQTTPPQTATYAPARPPPPPQQTSSSSSSSSGGIGGFFSSLFGGGSSNSDVTTASIHEQPAPAPATSVWIQTTTPSSPQPAAQAAPSPAQTAAAAPRPPPPPQAAPVQRPAPQAAPQAGNHGVRSKTKTQVSAAAPPAVAPPKKAPAASGKYHVQVAAVRSRDEAYALSVRLLSQHRSELGSRRPEVEQKVMGSMGVFYRVSVGPYASAAESQRLCGSLRASGFDCLIITQ
jgi:hypothetical protein